MSAVANFIYQRYPSRSTPHPSYRLARNTHKVYFYTMIVEKSPQTVFTPLEDGSGVLLNLQTLFYYNLNRTGAVLWQEIERSGQPTLNSLIEAVCKRFDVSEDGARQEILAFVERLKEFKMVRVVD